MTLAQSSRSALLVGAAIFAAGLSSLAAVAPALAAPITVFAAPQEEDGVRTVRVRYDDLDLASRTGRDRLDARVRGAVGRVCPGRERLQPVTMRQMLTRCRQVAFDGARPQVEEAVQLALRGDGERRAAMLAGGAN